MRPEPNHELDQYREPRPDMPTFPPGSNSGWFRIPTRTIVLRALSSGPITEDKLKALAQIPKLSVPELMRAFNLSQQKAEQVLAAHKKGEGGNSSLWEHVSISTTTRCPTWSEMCAVKDLFWSPDETVLQFHPKNTKYVNEHQYCLHLWKKCGVDHELPPEICV